MTEVLIYDLSAPGREGVKLPNTDVPEAPLPEGLVRTMLPLPEVSEIDVVRHFVRLSQLNYGIDIGFYPLGSCTMKYNPKINEDAARMTGFAFTHPLQDPEAAQGNLAGAAMGVGAFAAGAAYLLVLPPWRFPRAPIRRFYLGFLGIILAAAAMTVWQYSRMLTASQAPLLLVAGALFLALPRKGRVA